MSPETRIGFLAPAGLVVGPGLWAISTQAGQILPCASCGSALPAPALLAFAAAFGTLASGWLSWRAATPRIFPRRREATYPEAYPFVARISALASLLFAYALILQGISALVLTGCER